MCNLSQGVKEEGIAIGEAKLILKMHKNGLTPEKIAELIEKDTEDVIGIIENNM